MSGWTSEDLDTFGTAEEVLVAAADDGGPGREVPIWVVRVGDDLYVRSFKGRAGRWYQHMARSHQGRIRVGEVERAVVADEPGTAVNAEIDAVYAQKYAAHGDSLVRAMTTPEVTSTTLRLLPR